MLSVVDFVFQGPSMATPGLFLNFGTADVIGNMLMKRSQKDHKMQW